ncbi:DUF2284 domain-containing protein [Inediibacterium massiliense]|uniref:DUF2284 domain-containing protein n=1 Tax=Inediibacterium massiliense TaxID=1658111 RepID=UPI0006B50719|nr:DUF2284 domain-containing protein [Inediibacterium massiliense]
MEKLKRYIKSQQIHEVKEIEIDDLIIHKKVRDACIRNKCGQYGKNFMCPPYVGEIEDFQKRLKEYEKGFLITIQDHIKQPSIMENFYVSAIKLHHILLDIEKEAKKIGYEKAYALIGGNCKLCKVCNAKLGKDICNDPKRARPSLEAVGIDVIDTCKKVGISIEFKKNEVTWVGLILI